MRYKSKIEELLAWPFTTSLNHNITIWWGFFRQTAPAAMPVHVGANSLKKPHHIIILWFSEVVKGHANSAVSVSAETPNTNYKVRYLFKNDEFLLWIFCHFSLLTFRKAWNSLKCKIDLKSWLNCFSLLGLILHHYEVYYYIHICVYITRG